MLTENVDLFNISESLPKQMLQVGKALGLLLELQISFSWQVSCNLPKYSCLYWRQTFRPASMRETEETHTHIHTWNTRTYILEIISENFYIKWKHIQTPHNCDFFLASETPCTSDLGRLISELLFSSHNSRMGWKGPPQKGGDRADKQHHI